MKIFISVFNRSIPLIISVLISFSASSGAESYQKKRPGENGVTNFTGNLLFVDVRDADWDYIVSGNGEIKTGMYDLSKNAGDPASEYETIKNIKRWKKIHVGRRWESMGLPDLNDKTVWLRLKFFVPEDMKDYRFGFFCTAVDDAADFFLNGTYLGQRSYIWGARIPEPVNIDFSRNIQPGNENVLVIRLRDIAPARGGGILGNVVLYRTIPYTRTGNGGISVEGKGADRFSVVLHLGDGLLSKSQKTVFTSEELRSIEVPPYIFRDDELIIVSTPDKAKQKPTVYNVELDNVNPTSGNTPLSISCKDFPVKVDQYSRMRIPLDLSATYNNPFDAHEINVQAVIETPSGKTEKVPAFFWQDFTPVPIGDEEEILLPKPGNPWLLNYRPRETGIYNFHVIAQDRSGTKRTPDLKFEVSASAQKGFLRVSKNDPRYFEFDNGDSYFGIGPSGWLRNSNYIFGGNPRWISTRLLDEYYKRKADAGSNFDYCLAEFFGRLYIRGGYIDQHVAWKAEHRLRTLENLGIYWVTCYDDICRSVVYGLNTLPYSESQGGSCKSIEDLYFNETSLDMQKAHLRYFVSRMSDSPALMVWAIGDESQLGSKFSSLMVRLWIKDLQNYVRTIDVYQHPHIFGEGPLSIVNGGDAIIIPDWYFHKNTDAVSLTLEIMEKYSKFENCPLINPEGGMVEWTKPDDSYGPKRAGYYLTGERWKFPEAISFHNHLWISLFTKNAVGGTEWLGQWIDRKKELYHATAISNFLKGESLVKSHWEVASPVVSHNDLRGFCLESEGRSWAWVQNKFYTWLEAGHYGKKPPVITDSKISIPVKKDGNYSIEVWDTRNGKAVSTSKSFSKERMVEYALPPIENDVAIKVTIIN